MCATTQSTDTRIHRTLRIDGVERTTKGEGDRRVHLSLSSEEPVQRGGYQEILDHSAGAVDLRRARDGLPLLFDHDGRTPIGVIESVALVGKRLEGVARFGKSRDASERWEDVHSGILRNISVGYVIHKIREEDGNVLRAIRWEPYEASLVGIPADPTVGINRSFQEVHVTNTTETKAAPNGAINHQTIESERNRANEIMATGRHFDLLDDAEKAIREGISADKFKRHVLDKLGEREGHSTFSAGATRQSLQNGGFGGTADERRVREFSLSRAVRAVLTNDWREAGLEREVSSELSSRSGRSSEGLMVPSFALARRNLLTSTNAGGTLGTTHMGDLFVNTLREEVAVMNLGATVLRGLSKDVSIPRMTAGTASEWVGEDTSATESTPSFDSVPLTFHQLTANVRFSRKMAVQGDPSFEDLMRDDLRREIAIALDRAAIAGAGSAVEPEGILNTAGLGLVEMGTNGAAITWDKVVEFLESVEFANASVGKLAFLTNSRVKAAMMRTKVDAGSGKFILDAQEAGRLASHRIGFSQIVPATGAKGTGTGLSAMIFGNWRDLLIGEFGGMDLIIDPYTESTKGNIRVSVHSYWDVAVRHAASFAAANDILTV